MGAFDSPFLKAFDSYSEVFYWGGGVFAAFILLFFGRFALRAIVNRRTRSIHSATAMTFGDIASMKAKGVLSEEEYKRVRSRLAHRELEATKEQKAGLKAKDILLAIDQDPEMARTLIPQSGERAKQAMAGVAPKGTEAPEETPPPVAAPERSEPKPARAQPRRSAPEATLEEGFGGMPIPAEAIEADEDEASGGMPIPAEAPRRPKRPSPDPPRVKPPPPAPPSATTARPAPESVRRAAAATPKAAAPGPQPNPRPSAPQPARAASRPPAAPAPQPPPRDRGRDIDAMLAKGLISKEEYERLAAFFKPGGDDAGG